jgi:transposase-like protein
VDNRRYNRLAFRVLDHKPTRTDVRAFRSEFKAQLDQRGLSVRGITTDGSALYPKVLKKLWPGVPHQRCRFHVIQEIILAVRRALAKLRKEMKAKIPKQRRGRPSNTQRPLARRIKRRKKRVAELFKHRHLFVRHRLSTAQKKFL